MCPHSKSSKQFVVRLLNHPSSYIITQHLPNWGVNQIRTLISGSSCMLHNIQFALLVHSPTRVGVPQNTDHHWLAWMWNTILCIGCQRWSIFCEPLPSRSISWKVLVPRAESKPLSTASLGPAGEPTREIARSVRAAMKLTLSRMFVYWALQKWVYYLLVR